MEWPSDTLVVPGAVLGPPLGASIVSCAAHKLQAVVYPCLAAVRRGSLTCSCDNISVSFCVADHRERGAQHNYGVTICYNSIQRLIFSAILASTQSLCSCFYARKVIREVWGPTRTALRSMAAMLLVWQTRKRLQLCSVLSKAEMCALGQAWLQPYQGFGINSLDSCWRRSRLPQPFPSGTTGLKCLMAAS